MELNISSDIKSVEIPLESARRIALSAQLLDGRTKLPKGKEGIARTIETLGYVQIDTISVIERAHNHTLWTRNPDFSPEMLHELQAKDRRIFEYWGHAASYLPMSDYRFYLPRMRAFNDPHGKWEKDRLRKFGRLMQPVLERIKKEGPLSSSDFEPPPGVKKGTWWEWRPTKVALEMLFWRGDLMITERKNFERFYDLTENVLPEGIDLNYPDDDELGEYFVRRALNAFGVAREKEIREHIHGADGKIISSSLKRLIETGDVVEVKIISIDKGPYFALSETLENVSKLKKKKPVVHVISPFDNFHIQRERTKLLFDFDYAIECYTPAPKRVYGYFVTPILWGDKFVGRMDPKADRKKKTLLIQNLVFEPGFVEFDGFMPEFASKIRDFARFNGCEDIKLVKAQSKIRGIFKKHMS